MNTHSPELFQQQILAWFDINGRKNLPWQKNTSPYRIWLSEIMLQQTQVATAIPYFNQFIQSFPDIHQLASAPIDSVLHLWSGLGYYARARNLHKTAIIIDNNGSQFPNTLDSLLELPGIGRSTAGAILSIAFNDSHPILDGNVRRVLARFHAISGWTGSTAVNKDLWELSSRYTPKKRCADYTQAIMDMGATVCTRSKPHCAKCPIKTNCAALISNLVSKIPTPKPVKNKPIKHIVFLLLQDEDNKILLQKRPATGIWGGLWSLPEFTSPSAVKSWCQENQFSIKSIQYIDQQRHSFSHYHLDFTVTIVTTNNPKNKVMEANQSVWYKAEQIKKLGLPAPIKKLLQKQLERRVCQEQ